MRIGRGSRRSPLVQPAGESTPRQKPSSLVDRRLGGMERAPREGRYGDLVVAFPIQLAQLADAPSPGDGPEQLEGLPGEDHVGVFGAEIPSVAGSHLKRNTAGSGRLDQAPGGEGEADSDCVAVARAGN